MASSGLNPIIISSGGDDLFAVSHGEDHVWGFRPQDVTEWTPAFDHQITDFIQTGTVTVQNATGTAEISGTRIVSVTSEELSVETSTEFDESVDVEPGDGDLSDFIARTRTEYSGTVTIGSALTDTHIINGEWYLTQNNDFDYDTVSTWTPAFADQETSFTQTGTDGNGVQGGRVVTVEGSADSVEISTEAVENIDVSGDGDFADQIDRDVITYSASVTQGDAITNTFIGYGPWRVRVDISFDPSLVTEEWIPAFTNQVSDFIQSATDTNSLSGNRNVIVTGVDTISNVLESALPTSVGGPQDVNGDGDMLDTYELITHTWSASVDLGALITNTHITQSIGELINDVVFDSEDSVNVWTPAFTNQTDEFTQTATDSNGLTGSRSVTVNSEVLSSEQSTEAAIDVDVNNDGDKADAIERNRTEYSAVVGEGSAISNTHIIDGDWHVITNVDFNPDNIVGEWSPAFDNTVTTDFTQTATDTNNIVGTREVTVVSTSITSNPLDSSTEAAIGVDVNNDGDMYDLITRTRTRYSATVSLGSLISFTYDDVGDWTVSQNRTFNPSTVIAWSPLFDGQTSNFTQTGTDGQGLVGTRAVTVSGVTQTQTGYEGPANQSDGITVDVYSVGDISGDGDFVDVLQRTRTMYSASVSGGDSISNTHTTEYSGWTVASHRTETFGAWLPTFDNQESNFTQTRSGNYGNSQSRLITVTAGLSVENSTESAQGVDVNNDGDTFDSIQRTNAVFTTSPDIGTRTVNGTWFVTSNISETFSNNWTPSFSSQTSNFSQTRTGTQGTVQQRTIIVTQSTTYQTGFEGSSSQASAVGAGSASVYNIGDQNGDGDTYDSYTRSATTYNASNGLGSHSTGYGSWSLSVNRTESFGGWSPGFSNQTSSFQQSRTGTFGTTEYRTVTVSSSTENQYGFEGSYSQAQDVGAGSLDVYNLGDINGDGDTIDTCRRSRTTYTAGLGLGSFSTGYGSWSVTTNRSETFGSWSPAFSTQTSSFSQSRTGSAGTEETRTITVSSSTTTQYSTESAEGVDVNGDGDTLDSIRRTVFSYTTSPSVGSRTDEGPWSVYNDVNPVTVVATITGASNQATPGSYSASVSGTASGVIQYQWGSSSNNISISNSTGQSISASYTGSGSGGGTTLSLTVKRGDATDTDTKNVYISGVGSGEQGQEF